jgi:lipoprotein LprG
MTTNIRTHHFAAGILAVATALFLSGCTGGDEGVHDDQTPDEVLAGAADLLASTSGARLALSSDDFPSGTNGIIGAEGVTDTSPAFDGKLEVRISNTDFDVPVIAVGDKVWAQIPLTQGWSDIDPADYGAPDPSQLLTEDAGVGALLTATQSPEKGKSVRGGEDNSEVLTTYTGTIAGEVMKKVIPSSAGDTFDVTYRITEDGHLAEVDMTGVFYADTADMTYVLKVSEYGLDPSISAP